MAQQAHVTSVEAIETFRSHLLVYVSKVRPALEEVTADVLRMRSWLENEQRGHWEAELKKRGKALEQAMAELFSARISNLSKATAAQQMAVHRARREVDEATEKLRLLKRWSREFDGRVQPLVKQMEKLHTVLSHDMVLAAAYLADAVKTLSAYTEVAPPAAVQDSPPSLDGQARRARARPGKKSRLMSVLANRARLESLTRELALQWRQTRDYWRDAKADEFEHKYLDELLAGVDKTVTVIEELEKVTSRIRRDCE